MMRELEIGCKTDHERRQALSLTVAMTATAEQAGIPQRAVADAVCAMMAGIATHIGTDPLERLQALDALTAAARQHLIDNMVQRGTPQ